MNRMVVAARVALALFALPLAEGVAQAAEGEPECAPQRLMDAAFDLFPPAPVEQRRQAVELLATCHPPRVEGPLGAALQSDDDAAVRLAAVDALKRLNTAEAVAQLERFGRSKASDPARGAALLALVERGRFQVAWGRLFDPEEQPSLRAALLRAFDRAGVAPGDGPLSQLAEEGGELGQAAGTILSRREVAKAEAEALARREREAEEAARRPVVPEPTPPVAEAAPEPAVPAPEAAPTPVSAPVAVKEAPPVATPAPAAAPAAPVVVSPPEPEGPRDGSVLAIASSSMAGAALLGFFSELAQQNDPAVLLTVGSAGALIGGGTAFGLTRFGITPTLEQAAWYTNVTGWGALAGASFFAGSGSTDERLRWGLLAGGETLGLAAGIYSARRWDWTLPQLVQANTLVAGAGLTLLGGRLLTGRPLEFGPELAVATVPLMIGASVATRALDPSTDDLRLTALSAAGGAWSGALLGAGVGGKGLFGDPLSRGGAVAGLGLGYLGATAAGAFSEVSGSRAAFGTGGLLAGNVLGLGTHMLFAPGDPDHWMLGTGLGGVALGTAAFVAYPYLHLGDNAASMALTGATYGSGIWFLSALAGDTGRHLPEDRNLVLGGVLAAGVASGTAGLLASQYFQPGSEEHAATAAMTGLGFAGGLGAAKLAFKEKGGADSLGAILGSAAGFGMGAVVTHRLTLRSEDTLAAAWGGSYGLLLGTLAPSLDAPEWTGSRSEGGGALLGLSVGALGAGTLAHLADEDARGLNTAGLAGLLGASAGLGAGLLATEAGSQGPRIGVVAGALGFAGASIGTRHLLHLNRGLGPEAGGLSLLGTSLGGVYGTLLGAALGDGEVDLVHRRVAGGLLFGASSGLATGLTLSKLVEPDADDYVLVTSGAVLGGAMGLGGTLLASATAGPGDPTGALAGSLGGLVAGVTLANTLTLRPEDAHAALVGLGYGAGLGALAPSLSSQGLASSRQITGGALLGASAVATGAFAATHALGATDAQVAVPSTAGLFGALGGTGAGLLFSDRQPPVRRGAFVGTLSAAAASLALEPALRFQDGFGEGAGALGFASGALGLFNGTLLGFAVRPGGFEAAEVRQAFGGAMLGTAVGTAGGLVLTRFIHPDTSDLWLATVSDALGTGLGLGVSLLRVDARNFTDSVGLLAGSLAGLGVGAGLAHLELVSPLDAGSAAVGYGFGALAGSLLPAANDVVWEADHRALGGALVGGTLSALGAGVASHVTAASPEQLGTFTASAALGLGAGLGTGLMFAADTSRRARLGTVAGLGAGVLAASIGEPTLHLSQGFGETASSFATAGATAGGALGLLASGALSSDGTLSGATGAARFGGILAGVSLGLPTGLLLSRRATLTSEDVAVAYGSGALFGTLGRGVSMVAFEEEGRHDSLLTLAGAAGGLAGGAALQHFAPLDGLDTYALVEGAAFGGLVGRLGPTLRSPELLPLDRHTTGWTLFGGAGAAAAAVALRRATDADAGDLGLVLLGGADGIATGLGAGLAVGTSRAQRIGVTAGAVGGLGIGALVWPRLHDVDAGVVTVGTLAGAWTGTWLPALGHARLSEVQSRQLWGGMLAGAGAGSLAGSIAGNWLQSDADAVSDGLVIGALLSGAGAGAGALASPRDDVAIAGMLGGGFLGATLGGVLHERVHFGEVSEGLTLSLAEGLWFGALAPRLWLEDVTARQTLGGMAAGALGFAAAESLLKLTPSSDQALLAGAGTVAGAAMAGGVVLTTDSLRGTSRGTALLMGGSAAGLGAGLLAGRTLELRPGLFGAASLGALLGGTEALTFAWAGRATQATTWQGFTLFGAGAGATLGLAAAAYPKLTMSEIPGAASLAAWGAGVGCFAGAIFNPNPHEVTLGGVLGANIGFLSGYGALRSGLVEARDIGWLSAFGAVGLVAGGAVGAPLSSRDDPRPVLAGLAVGPVLGMAAGAVALPHLRKALAAPDASAPPADEKHGSARPESGRDFTRVAGIADWQPTFGAAPAGTETRGEHPVMQIGATGRLW